MPACSDRVEEPLTGNQTNGRTEGQADMQKRVYTLKLKLFDALLDSTATRLFLHESHRNLYFYIEIRAFYTSEKIPRCR